MMRNKNARREKRFQTFHAVEHQTQTKRRFSTVKAFYIARESRRREDEKWKLNERERKALCLQYSFDRSQVLCIVAYQNKQTSGFLLREKVENNPIV